MTSSGRPGTPVLVRVLVLLVLGVVVSLVAAAVLLARANPPAVDGWLTGTAATAPGALALGVAGGVLVWWRPRLLIGRLLVLGALAAAVDAAGGQYLAYAALTHPGAPYGPWIPVLTRLASAVEVLVPPAILLLVPDGVLPGRRWRLPVAAWCAGAVALCVASLVPTRVADRVYDAGIPQPVVDLADRGVPGVLPDGAWESLLRALPFLVVPLVVLPVVVCLVRYRASGPVARAQLRWVFLGGALDLALTALAPALPDPVFWLAGFLGSAAFAAGVLVGVARYRLYDIDLVLNRGLLYGLLSLVIVAVYVGVVALLSAVVPGGRVDLRGVLAAAAVAAVVAPARTRLVRLADRVVRGVTGDPYAAVAGLAQRLEASAGTEELLGALARSVATAFGCPYVGVRLAGAEAPAAELGQVTGPVERHPLVYRGSTVGELSLQLPRGTRLRPQERALLEDLVRQAGLAAHAAARTEELLAAREQLVTAREEERRRIRRDLHDGLGPVLGALTLKLDAARRLGPDESDRVLVGAKRDLGEAMLDLRRLVHGLRPPALDDLGLVAALEQQLAQPTTGAGFAVQVVSSEDLGDLPAAVEVAAFRVASEAVANAARHSGGTRCEVVVRRDTAGDLVVEVTDDGRGVDPGSSRGVGLASMDERAQELGGRVEVSGAPGSGTRVVVHLPAHARPTADVS